jgi:hypothetical protein
MVETAVQLLLRLVLLLGLFGPDLVFGSQGPKRTRPAGDPQKSLPSDFAGAGCGFQALLEVVLLLSIQSLVLTAAFSVAELLESTI